jgi:hypothetical protein
MVVLVQYSLKKARLSLLINIIGFCWASKVAESHSWQMTDSLKLPRFNQSIVNSGTFELRDSILVTKALFAPNQMFVNGLAIFRCSVSGDTLILTGLSVSSADDILHPLYAGKSHIVNKLLKIKPVNKLIYRNCRFIRYQYAFYKMNAIQKLRQ